MSTEIEFIQRLVQNLLIQLGEQAPDWRIADAGYLQIGNVLTADEPTNTIEVALESISGSYSPVVVDFTVDAPFIYAVLELASQVQDHAVEATRGANVPPCPDHTHPATARLDDDVPKWVCLQLGADYYAADILPGLSPQHTLKDYIGDNPVGASAG